MRFALSTPPNEGDTWGSGGLPNVGLMYLSGSLSNIPGLQVKILDACAEGLNTAEATQRILASSPDVFGLSAMSTNLQRGLRLLKSVKKAAPHILTVMGGYHATAFHDLLLDQVPELDLVLRGEADRSLPELMRRLMHGEPLEGVPGLSYRLNGSVSAGEPQFIEDLDSLPFPDRAYLESYGYWKQWAGRVIPEMPSVAPMISSRGCPHTCTFCSKLTPGSRIYRARSAENVFQEIVELAEAGYETIIFMDENFTRSVTRLKKLCHMILDRGLKQRFWFQGTLHNLSQSVLDLMHRAGFDGAAVGVESGSTAQLRRYKKYTTGPGMAAGIKRAKKAHMFIVAFFIHGAPGETLEDCRATNDFVLSARPHYCGSAVLEVFPGSELWKEFIGPDLPENTVEASQHKSIYTFPGQLNKQEIDKRVDEFQRAYVKSWLNLKRIPEVVDLVRYNRTMRHIFISVLKRPGTLMSILFPSKLHGGPPMADQAYVGTRQA